MSPTSARFKRPWFIAGLLTGAFLWMGCAGRELPPVTEHVPPAGSAVASSTRPSLPITAPSFPATGSTQPPGVAPETAPESQPIRKTTEPVGETTQSGAETSAPQPSALVGPTGEPFVDESKIIISGEWLTYPITDLLTEIANANGLQFFVSQQVTGIVSISLNAGGMSLSSFLDYVTAILGATYKKIGPRTYFIGAADARNPAFSRMAESAVLTLKYISVTQLRSLLPDWAISYVRLDTTEPYAVISAPTLLLEQVKKEIEKIDKPQKQVSIHALFVELNEDAGKELGITWNWNAVSAAPVEGQSKGITGFSVQRDKGGTFQDAFGVTLTGEMAHQVQVTLNTLESKGLAKIRSYPSVVAQNGRLSQMELGLEQYFRVEAGTVAFPRVEIEKIPSGVILKVTPQIAENGDITLALEPSVDDIVAVGPEGLPTIRKRKVTATVRVRDGETVVLGGLVEERDSKLERKTPILGSLPVIGRLFRSTRTDTVRKEVAIFITPRILQER